MSADGGVLSKEILIESLDKILSASQRTRRKTKAHIKAWSSTNADVFGVLLIDIVIDPNIKLPVSLLASQYLRDHARTYFCVWNSRLEPPPIDIKSKMKRKIKDLLLRGLKNPISELRTAIAHVISDIAYADWPRNWPHLYNTLSDYLKEEVRSSTDGAMQVLLNATESKSPSAIANGAILQEITRTFVGDSQYSMEWRGKAVYIFTNIVDTCNVMFVQHHLQPTIPMFCEKFIQILSEPNDSTNDPYGLETNIVSAITTLIQKIPKCVSDFLPRMLPAIWKTLIDNAKVYQENNMSRDVGNADGKSVKNFDNLLKVILQFIRALMSRPNKRDSELSEYALLEQHWFYLQHSLSPKIFHHLIPLMKADDDSIENWQDLSTFLRDEESLGNLKGARGLVREFVNSISCCPENSAANALVVVILKEMETANMTQVSRNSELKTDWKLHEAYLLAFCLAKDLIVEKLHKGSLHFDIATFLETVVLVDLNNPTSHPLLIGRCLCLGGLYAEQMTPKVASRFLEATASGLRSEHSLTRLLAAMAAKHWFRAAAIEGNNSYKELLKPYLLVLFQGLFDLVASLSPQHIIELVFKNIHLLALFHKVFDTSSGDKRIYTLTVSEYVKTHKTCDIYTIFKKLFLKCSLDRKYATLFRICWVPMFIDIMTSNATDRSDDEQIIGRRHDSEEMGLHYILHSLLITKVEIACETVRLLIEKMGNALPFDGSAMRNLLIATKNHSLHPILLRELLIIWSNLLVNQTDHVFNFLSTAPLIQSAEGREKEALLFVMKDGLYDNYKLFDLVERKAVIPAFCKILEYGIRHPQSQLLHCAVIKEAEGGKKIPFLVKVCQLITNEWSKKDC